VALWVVFAKRRIDAACTVQDAHDVDPVTDRQVEDEIPAERETPDPGGEFVARIPGRIPGTVRLGNAAYFSEWEPHLGNR
jgi:hypothetical protein